MKKTVKILVSALCAAAMCGSLVSLGGCGNDKERITVSGSSSVTPLMEKLAAQYEKNHDVRITVNMSSSGAGISDTLNGLNDIGMVSRELDESETGCAVDNVSKADVKALFEKGTAIPDTTITSGIGRDASSGTRKAFDELLEIKNGYAATNSTLAETGNVIEAIQGSTNSIGYISFGSLKNTVKAVSLDGIACTVENIINNTYALQRPFIIVVKQNAELSSAAQGFYDYIVSAEAQSVITGEGYISVK